MTQASLARKLRLLRAERKLSLRQAAKLTGLAKETLSDLERGRRHPNDVTLAKVAEGYDISVEELFELEAESVEEPATSVGKAEAPSPPELSETASEEERRLLGALLLKQRELEEEAAYWKKFAEDELLLWQRELEEEAAYWNKLAEGGQISFPILKNTAERIVFTAEHFQNLVKAFRTERWNDEKSYLLDRIIEKGLRPQKAAWDALLEACVAGHSASDLTPLRRRGDEAARRIQEARNQIPGVA